MNHATKQSAEQQLSIWYGSTTAEGLLEYGCHMVLIKHTAPGEEDFLFAAPAATTINELVENLVGVSQPILWQFWCGGGARRGLLHRHPL